MQQHAQAQTAQGFHRFCEVASTIIFPIMCLASCVLAWPVLSSSGLLWTLLLVVPLSWAFSDAFTGFIHWMFDTYWEEDTPFLGQAFVQPFREHHDYPKNICHHDLFSTVGNSCILGVILQTLLLSWQAFYPSSSFVAISTLFISLAFAGAALTNLFHKWSHADQNPAWVQTLQRAGLILGTEHHNVHHTAPHDTYYCITCGWMNPVLDKIAFFKTLEKLLAMVGIHPSNTAESHHKMGT